MTVVKTFVARPGSHVSNKDAQRIGSFLEETFGEELFTPADVVEKARPEESPIHNDFDWDVAEAAEKWNLHQARQLIGSVMLIQENGENIATRAFHHVVENSLQAGGKVRGYTSDHVVWQREDFAEQVIERAKREFIAWQQRYAEYGDLRDWAREQLAE